jgi:hypothetical protein
MKTGRVVVEKLINFCYLLDGGRWLFSLGTVKKEGRASRCQNSGLEAKGSQKGRPGDWL